MKPNLFVSMLFLLPLAVACGDNLGPGGAGGGDGDGGGDGAGEVDGGGGGDGDGGGTACTAPFEGSPCADTSECMRTEGGAECEANLECLPDQSGTSGQCTTVGCTVGDDTTCAPGSDATCVDFDGEGEGEPSCIDPCETTEDCNTDDGQRCVDSGDEAIGMYCRHSEIGDPCGAAAECGQDPWLCKTEAEDMWPGGYCSIPCGGGCPDGTVCNNNVLDGGDEFCVEECNQILAACDRDGYICQDVNAAGGLQLGCAPDPDL